MNSPAATLDAPASCDLVLPVKFAYAVDSRDQQSAQSEDAAQNTPQADEADLLVSPIW